MVLIHLGRLCLGFKEWFIIQSYWKIIFVMITMKSLRSFMKYFLKVTLNIHNPNALFIYLKVYLVCQRPLFLTRVVKCDAILCRWKEMIIVNSFKFVVPNFRGLKENCIITPAIENWCVLSRKPMKIGVWRIIMNSQ